MQSQFSVLLALSLIFITTTSGWERQECRTHCLHSKSYKSIQAGRGRGGGEAAEASVLGSRRSRGSIYGGEALTLRGGNGAEAGGEEGEEEQGSEYEEGEGEGPHSSSSDRAAFQRWADEELAHQKPLGDEEMAQMMADIGARMLPSEKAQAKKIIDSMMEEDSDSDEEEEDRREKKEEKKEEEEEEQKEGEVLGKKQDGDKSLKSDVMKEASRAPSSSVRDALRAEGPSPPAREGEASEDIQTPEEIALEQQSPPCPLLFRQRTPPPAPTGMPGELERDVLSSLWTDATFVSFFASLVTPLPLICNAPRGGWTSPPWAWKAISTLCAPNGNATSALSHLEMQPHYELAELLALSGGGVLVDSPLAWDTSRAPPSLTVAAPIFCCLVNNAVRRGRITEGKLSHSSWPNTTFWGSRVNAKEIKYVESKASEWGRSYDWSNIVRLLEKPLRCLWITPEAVYRLGKLPRPHELPFTPLYCVSPSQSRARPLSLPGARSIDDPADFYYLPAAGFKCRALGIKGGFATWRALARSGAPRNAEKALKMVEEIKQDEANGREGGQGADSDGRGGEEGAVAANITGSRDGDDAVGKDDAGAGGKSGGVAEEGDVPAKDGVGVGGGGDVGEMGGVDELGGGGVGGGVEEERRIAQEAFQKWRSEHKQEDSSIDQDEDDSYSDEGVESSADQGSGEGEDWGDWGGEDDPGGGGLDGMAAFGESRICSVTHEFMGVVPDQATRRIMLQAFDAVFCVGRMVVDGVDDGERIVRVVGQAQEGATGGMLVKSVKDAQLDGCQGWVVSEEDLDWFYDCASGGRCIIIMAPSSSTLPHAASPNDIALWALCSSFLPPCAPGKSFTLRGSVARRGSVDRHTVREIIKSVIKCAPSSPPSASCISAVQAYFCSSQDGADAVQ